ncbi:Murein tetrapeptide carboxypeptidase [Candidatus Bodocaedibacter vickermanii]|uniref:Murein tetrapeptide carboxypeptidase n=1 Tax=Candidatus Bodocaedibacter vickermanii TaxID=2741701 RepID=A0A7L9RRW1_9PROT|nr:Murein tetrapeptide carboxypeptidase [Candidatus Paracaedibacteraceae bacterium 'Lake Konstanz']
MEKLLKLSKTLPVLAIVFLYGCEANNFDSSIANTPSRADLLIKGIAEGKISVVAPATWIEENESRVIQKKYPNLWNKVHFQHGVKYAYMSNTDEQRFNFLKQAFDNESSSVVWALRGGYGAARLIPYLLKIPKPTAHKWLIGYSDITALHLFVSQKWGWKSIHGAVAKDITYSKKDPKNFKYLDEIVSGASKSITYQGFKLLSGKVMQPIAGKLTGGNTALISTSVGTPWQLNAKGKIVIIEESGHGDRIDRVLQHLKHSKILEGAVAVVIGDIIVGDVDVNPIINDFVKDLPVPVFKTDSFGHGDKNYPWIYNADAVIEPDAMGNYQLTFQTQ